MEIRLAKTGDELAAIYRFRYAVYVEEMQRKQRYADHFAKQIIDPLDDRCYLLGAWRRGEVIGTLRTNFARETDLGEYFDMYQIARLPKTQIETTSITTRLMIRPNYRKGTLATRMAQTIYRFGLGKGITTDLMDCNEHLLPFFTGLGYRPHQPHLRHPEYGSVAVLKLDATDQLHLDNLRSPFAGILRDWLAQQTVHHPGENTNEDSSRTSNIETPAPGRRSREQEPFAAAT